VGTERFHNDSDIDIAAHFINEPTFEELVALKAKIERELNRDIDLVSLNFVDPIFAQQVLETGRLIYTTKDKVELLSWKTQIMSMYPDFKMSRKIIEDSLLNRKKNV
jgi:predicted nucleotidyltransferase